MGINRLFGCFCSRHGYSIIQHSTTAFPFVCHCQRYQLKIYIISKQLMRHVDVSQLEGNQLMNTSEYMKDHKFELRRKIWRCYWSSQSIKAWQNSGLNEIRTCDLCDTGSVLYQLSYQVSWELVSLSVGNILVDGLEHIWIWPQFHNCLRCVYDCDGDYHIFIYFSAIKTYGLSYIHLYRNHLRVCCELTMWPAPSWLDSSGGRAMHRYRRVITQSEYLICRHSLTTTSLLIWDKRAVLTKEFQDMYPGKS